MLTFESLTVDVIADTLGWLDLTSLINVCYLSRRLHYICSDNSLNPWRRPIFRNLRSGEYEDCLKHLSVRLTVPRQNWVEILSIARAHFLLFEATLPSLKECEWEECFRRRFLPGWSQWKKEGHWREAFLKTLHRTWHRSNTLCTADEAWMKYIVLNCNSSANELESSSRNFHPLSLFNEMKFQTNLAHLETRVRLVVEFADVRILAFGTLNKPRSSFSVNPNARSFLHPPGIDPDTTSPFDVSSHDSIGYVDHHGTKFQHGAISAKYTRLAHPLPAPSHANFPFLTQGGGDKRWTEDLEEDGMQWVGGMMITAQILGPGTHDSGEGPSSQDVDLVVGPSRSQYASFTWSDLWAIAPWMEDKITKKITGPGLGHF